MQEDASSCLLCLFFVVSLLFKYLRIPTVYTNQHSEPTETEETDTHCSSSRLNCLRSRSGCHTSSGLGCSCYSRSEIHEVRRSFHLFHQEQTNTKMEMASKSMNINSALAIIFSMCNHRFLRASLSIPDSEFKTQCALQSLTHHEMKYLTALAIILNRLYGTELARLNFLRGSIRDNFRTQQKPEN